MGSGAAEEGRKHGGASVDGVYVDSGVLLEEAGGEAAVPVAQDECATGCGGLVQECSAGPGEKGAEGEQFHPAIEIGEAVEVGGGVHLRTRTRGASRTRSAAARLVELAREYGFYLIQDLAYADIAFDGYKPPSVLEVPGAKEVAVEFFTLSKSYNMPGWRVGFMVGNPVLVSALARLKSYFDYGTFTPIQVASIHALEGPQECVHEICENYRLRRNVLVEGLNKLGWPVALPKATMFVWAQIPEQYRRLGSLEFSKVLLNEAKVAVSPGIGFGDYGDGHVRFSLIENEERTRQALRGIRQMLAKG